VAHHDRDWAPYDEFQAKTDREIPVVVLEPVWFERPFNSITPTPLGGRRRPMVPAWRIGRRVGSLRARSGNVRPHPGGFPPRDDLGAA
jgi:hypothetical protein